MLTESNDTFGPLALLGNVVFGVTRLPNRIAGYDSNSPPTFQGYSWAIQLGQNYQEILVVLVRRADHR